MDLQGINDRVIFSRTICGRQGDGEHQQYQQRQTFHKRYDGSKRVQDLRQQIEIPLV